MARPPASPPRDSAPASALWGCSQCTFQNPSAGASCLVCSSPRGGKSGGAGSAPSAPPSAPLARPRSAGGAPPHASAVHPLWRCAACTLFNTDSVHMCALCNTARGAAAPVMREAAVVGGGIGGGGANAAASRGSGAMPTSTVWDCSVCTLSNRAGSLHCMICAAPRPPPSRSASPNSPPSARTAAVMAASLADVARPRSASPDVRKRGGGAAEVSDL